MLADEKCYGMFKEQPMWGRVVECEVPEKLWHLTPEILVAFCKEIGFYLE